MTSQTAPPSDRYLPRSIFVSLPARQPLINYVESTLAEAIRRSFGRMLTVSFRIVNQGPWLQQIEHGIAYSNAVVAFLEGHNPNVLLEVGEAYALGWLGYSNYMLSNLVRPSIS